MYINLSSTVYLYLTWVVTDITGFSLDRLLKPDCHILVHVVKRTAKIWEPWELNRRICPPSLCRQADESGREVERPRGTANTPFFQGDIVLDKVSERYIYGYTTSGRSNGRGQGRSRRKRATIRAKNRLWKNGVVPYVIDSDINPMSRKWILKAIKHIQEKTCVRFKKRRRKSDKHYILFKSEPGCWSSIGRRGGEQIISLGRGCEFLGTAVHEIMHALGTWHEQAREDRNEYVKILEENISPRFLPDFNIIDRNISSSRGYPYDYQSIMHYSQFAFTRNGEPTIEVKGVGKKRNLKIGQREGMSIIDIAQIRDMYQCNIKEDAKATECPKGWTKNQVSCYKFFPKKPSQFSAAHRHCSSLRSHLVSVDTRPEERFLEAYIGGRYKSERVWRTGGRRVNGTFRWYRGEKKRSRKLSYKNWDKQHPGTYTTMALVRDSNSSRFVWQGVWAGSTSQLPRFTYPFICERMAKRKCLKLKFKDGRDYRGTLDHTIDGVTCQKWSSQYPHEHNNIPKRTAKDDIDGLGDHNYCRNPKGTKRRNRPWCYTTKKSKKWQYCDVTSCRKKKKKPKQKPDKNKNNSKTNKETNNNNKPNVKEKPRPKPTGKTKPKIKPNLKPHKNPASNKRRIVPKPNFRRNQKYNRKYKSKLSSSRKFGFKRKRKLHGRHKRLVETID